MKHLVLLFFALFLFTTCQHETRLPVAMAMCAPISTSETTTTTPPPLCHDPQAEFANFASDPAFRAMHPYFRKGHTAFAGAMVTFPVIGGADGRGYLSKAPNGETTRYLFLFHEWWGLNDVTKNEADMWAKELNINVLAVDLYDGKLATTPEDAGKYMQGNDAARSLAIIEGASQYTGKKANIRTMGWCFGGGWSLQAALALKKKAKGCVMYYGMPEKDLAKLKKLKCDVIFIHAKKDKWINDDVVAEFEKNMQAARKNLRVFRYDADHAFANPSSPRYDDSAAKSAREVSRIFLSKR